MYFFVLYRTVHFLSYIDTAFTPWSPSAGTELQVLRSDQATQLGRSPTSPHPLRRFYCILSSMFSNVLKCRTKYANFTSKKKCDKAVPLLAEKSRQWPFPSSSYPEVEVQACMQYSIKQSCVRYDKHGTYYAAVIPPPLLSNMSHLPISSRDASLH